MSSIAPISSLGAVELAGAEPVEELAAQLARGFGEAVAVRRDVELQMSSGVGSGSSRTSASVQPRFGELLLRVGERAARTHVGMADERGVGFGEMVARFAGELSSAASYSPRCVARIDAAQAWIACAPR